MFHWETAGAADIITRRGFKYTFQVGPAAYRYSQAAVDFVTDELTKKLGKPLADLRIALLWENRAFGKSVGDGVRAYAVTEGINLTYDEGYDQFATDMTPIVQKLKDVNPDVLIAISFPNDAILFQRKAKELDFNVAALVGVSAGYSNPDLRGSIGDMVNGIFVSDFAAKVNPKALLPATVPIAEEFFKRYDDKLHRPPAGHASSSFSATWALFTEVLPKSTTLEPAELREIALKLDLPNGALANGGGSSSLTMTGQPTPKTPDKISGPRSASGNGRRPGTIRCTRRTSPPTNRSCPAAGLEQALRRSRRTHREEPRPCNSAAARARATERLS